jgi:hypothetical protein
LRPKRIGNEVALPSTIASSMPVSRIREIMELAWEDPEVIHLEVGSPTFLPLRISSTLPTRLRWRAIPATPRTRAFLSCAKPWRRRSPGATVTRRARIRWW